jgi:hypothetical protein
MIVDEEVIQRLASLLKTQEVSELVPSTPLVPSSSVPS